MNGIANLQTLMASYGEADVPINATEFGWTAHTNTGTEKGWEIGVTEDQQADYTLRGFGILGNFPQVKTAFVYTDRDFSNSNAWGDRFGLLRADLTPKKGYFALKCVASNVCGPEANPVPAPDAPLAPEGTYGASGIALTWGSVEGATGYRVYRSADGEANHQVAQIGTTSWNDNSVTAGTTYTYTVTAYNSGGQSAPSPSVSVPVPLVAPATPTGVTVTATGSTTATISWSAVPGAATYTVTRTPAAGTPVNLAAVTTTSANDTGLTPGASYTYTVRATNSAGSSPPSAPVPVTLPNPPALPATYVAAGASQWRINDSGSNLGTAWRSTTYDHSAWRQGSTEIGYGDGDESTSVAPSRITYYFRKTFDAGTDISRVARLSLRAIVDDGAVLYLNGTEVWRYNMPAGTISSTTRASTFVAGTGETTWRTATLPRTALRTGTNVLAIEVHNDAPSSSDISMNLELTAS